MKTSKKIALVSLIGGIYLILTLIFSVFSFGIIQIRMSEALTILSVFSPIGVLGVSFGCFFSNLIGFMMGLTTYWDLLFGTLATALSAVVAYKLRNLKFKELPILSSLMPVLFNSVIVGAMLYQTTYSGNDIKVLIFYMLSVAVGEFISATMIGLFLYSILNRMDFKKYLEG